MILCSTPGCDAVLRHVAGLHQEGEPYMQSEETGTFMICLKCGARVAWQEPQEAPRSPGPAVAA